MGTEMKTLIIALYPYNGQGLDAWHDHGAGMTYTAAKNAGCNVDFLDMKTLNNDRELELTIKGYDLIAFGLKSSYYSIGMKVIEIAKRLGAKTLIAGYHATAAPEQLEENPLIDYIFHGESEITFPQFLQDPSKFNRTIIGEKPSNLDLLPFFDRSIYRDPVEPVKGWWYGPGRERMVSVMAARGCPYECGFCQPIEHNHFGKKLRRRSVDSVIEELLWLKKLHQPDCIMIHDDTFLIQPKWIEEFIDKYPQVNLPFWASARVDGICDHPDLVKKLVKVGWELISVGFESGSQRILDLMKKGTTVEQNLESVNIIRSTGAKIYANYMLGLPWETKSDIQATARMADTINAEMPSWAFFTPYPGCDLGEQCIKEGLSLLDRNNYNRCPSGQKCKGVDYNYLNAVLRGLRGDGNITEHPICDIIIPTYENTDYTIACLNSIKECTESPYQVIWVDNASKDTSKIEEVISDMPHISIKMPSNQGFVHAVNAGLNVSKSPYVCLLNNDTIVSKNWLGKLINILKHDPKLGIVGSLTMPDPRGSGQMDSHHSLSLHNTIVPNQLNMSMEEINRYLEANYSGRTCATPFVAFLCAVIKREVIDKVGLLDTNYELGMWDDNDYNLAARELGYKTEFAIDTCIYHKGRSTFNMIQEKEGFDIDALLKKNRAYMDKKWGLGVINYRTQIKLTHGPSHARGPSWRDKLASAGA